MTANPLISTIGPGMDAWTSDDRGSATTEYALLIAGIVAAVITATSSFDVASLFRFENRPGITASSPDRVWRYVARGGSPEVRKSFDLRSEHEKLLAGRGVPIIVLTGVLWLLLKDPVGRPRGWLRKLRDQAGRLLRAWHVFAEQRAPTTRYQSYLRGSETSQARFISKRQDILKTLSIDVRRLLPSNLQVRHLMTAKVTTAHPSVSIADLRQRLRQSEIRHILICDEHHQLVGLVSDRDLRAAKGGTAGDVMMRSPITVGSATLAKTAISMMLEEHVGCLPVVDDGKLIGILTTTDVMMTFQCAMQILERWSKDPPRGGGATVRERTTEGDRARCAVNAAPFNGYRDASEQTLH